jgi:hypothetical protein
MMLSKILEEYSYIVRMEKSWDEEERYSEILHFCGFLFCVIKKGNKLSWAGVWQCEIGGYMHKENLMGDVLFFAIN